MKYSNCIRFLVLFGTLLFSSICHSDALSGRVVSVVDGDTIIVLDSANTQIKIRLKGIDAPEKKQAFGTRSKESLSALLFDKQVTIEFRKTDRYGRPVGKILVDGIDVNLEQVKVGMAWHYKQYEREQSVDDRAAYAQAEEQVRAAKTGLWADTAPTPPWDWRRSNKSSN